MSHFEQHRRFILSSRLVAHASRMRAEPTTTEARLWREISGCKLGVAFRRQVPVGRYIADFLAPSVRLVVEVDGGYHGRRVTADAHRDRDLARLGYTLLHLEAELVLTALPGAVERVREAVQAARLLKCGG